MSLKCALLLTLLIAAASCLESQKAKSAKVVGGSNVAAGSAPYMAQIWALQMFFMCGGTIITSKTILTAAHCIGTMTNAEFYSAVVGTTSLNDRTYAYTASEVIIHSNYNWVSHVNDIGLLILQNAIDFETVPAAPIILDNDVIGVGHDVSVFGWGIADFPAGGSSSSLQTAVSETMANTDCSLILIGTSVPQLAVSHMCAYSENGGACTGDHGGPLVSSSGYQVGILTQMSVTCTSGNPDIYTRISSHVEWLQENIQ